MYIQLEMAVFRRIISQVVREQHLCLSAYKAKMVFTNTLVTAHSRAPLHARDVFTSIPAAQPLRRSRAQLQECYFFCYGLE